MLNANLNNARPYFRASALACALAACGGDGSWAGPDAGPSNVDASTPPLPADTMCSTIVGDPESCQTSNVESRRSVGGGSVRVSLETQVPYMLRLFGDGQCCYDQMHETSAGITVVFQVPEGASLPYRIRQGTITCHNCLRAWRSCCTRNTCYGGSCRYASGINVGEVTGTVFALSANGVEGEIEAELIPDSGPGCPIRDCCQDGEPLPALTYKGRFSVPF